MYCAQVDLIICYDASASATRQNQRMGRTGRHRDGKIIYILEKTKCVTHAAHAHHAARASYVLPCLCTYHTCFMQNIG